MAQRPSFDMTRISTADKILGVGSLLLFIDSLFSWQQRCTPEIVNIRFCEQANAWGGNGSFAGVLMGLFALLLLIAIAVTVAGIEVPLTIPVSTVVSGLAAGTVLFGIIKFLFAVTNFGAWAAWVGLILILAIAYGGFMKMQEAKAASPPADTGFSA